MEPQATTQPATPPVAQVTPERLAVLFVQRHGRVNPRVAALIASLAGLGQAVRA